MNQTLEPDVADTTASSDRPWLFGLLIAPSAVVANGVIQGGVLAYLLSRQGVGSGAQSHLIWLLALPTSLYFLWSPITDFFVKRRTWLALGSVTAAVLMFLAFHQPSLTSKTSEILMLMSACCSQLVVSACGGMMGALSTERGKRVAGSFYQAGGMGFGAAAVSVMIALSPRVSRDVVGLVAAAMIGLPGLFALAAPEQHEIADGELSETLRRMGTEFKSTFWRWDAVPYTLCMIFPGATGSAAALLPGVAKAYGVNGDSVAWMNGIGGALLMAGGALTASFLPARSRAMVVYMLVGLTNVAAAAVLWLGPLNPATYYTGVTLYLFTLGVCYAMFTAVVLEFMGDSGKSGSGRYSIINSLGNVPVLYMIILDGWGGEKFGPRGISGIEAVVGGAGVVSLLVYLLMRGRSRTVDAPTGA
jgi:PAT family beta-lactamase induction signal transducer AmpG